KDGELVGTGFTRDFSTAQIVSMMVGRELSSYYPPYGDPATFGEPVLTIADGANDEIHDINLTIHAGEIAGLAGLEGSGRTELARAVFGVDPFTHGEMTLNSSIVRFSDPREAIDAGVGL